MHDAQLINGIRKGDHDTFRFIFDHYYALMCSIAYEYVEDYHLSQNIAEDVMLSIWEKRELLNISTSVKSYLLTSVHNKSIDYLRSYSREAEVVSFESEIASGPPPGCSGRGGRWWRSAPCPCWTTRCPPTTSWPAPRPPPTWPGSTG